ncbi:hypothetical protein GCM10010271_67900 [Streptomyces kurssanovii]|nr:hypothetical protein GCM10010271_67900 [Streptomyces kurssanovii]
MSRDGIDSSGYGREFADWYDRMFPDDGLADLTAKALASMLPDGARGALELGVGTGRVAIPLSRFTRVVGVDSAPEMIEVFGEAIAQTSADAESVLADMRSFSRAEQYPLVYCICGSLSLVTDPDDQQTVIRLAAEHVAPGGTLVVETHNKPAVLAFHDGQPRITYFVPYPEPGTGLQTHSTLIPGTDLWQCSHIWFESDGTSRVGTEVTRLTSPDEVDAYAANAGLTPAARWADWHRAPYSEQAGTYICAYKRDA